MEPLHKNALNQNIYSASNDESFNFLSHSSLVNNTELLFASFNDQIRFLLNDGSLAIATNISDAVREKIVQKNYLSFYFGSGHAALELNCQSCENEKPFNKFYDLNGPVGVFDKLSDIMGFHEYAKNYRKEHGIRSKEYTLKLFLNDAQAVRSFSALDNINEMAKAGEYKYVYELHNCAALLVDIYQDSGFPHHLSRYLTNDELMIDDNDSVRLLPAYRFHYTYPDSYLHPDREKVDHFVKTTILNKYKYDALVKERGYAIKVYENIDLEEAKKSPFITSVIEEIKETRQVIYPELVERSSHLMRHCDITEVEKKEILESYLNKNITYKDLYYEHYVPKHILEMMKFFEKTPYQGIDIIQQFCWNYHDYSYCKKFQSVGTDSFDVGNTPVTEIFLSGDSATASEVNG